MGNFLKSMLFMVLAFVSIAAIYQLNTDKSGISGRDEDLPSSSIQKSKLDQKSNIQAKNNRFHNGESGGHPHKGSIKRNPASIPRKPELPRHAFSNYLKKKYGGDWEEAYGENGELTDVMGGSIPDVGTDYEKGFDLAKELVPYLGFSESDLMKHDGDNPETDRRKSMSYLQTAYGYQVYSSYLSFRVNKKNNSIYLITNKMKDIDLPSSTPGVNSEQAKDVIYKKYPKDSIKEIRLRKDEPIIWAETHPHEISWEYVVVLKNAEFDVRNIVVGSDSLKILKDATFVFH